MHGRRIETDVERCGASGCSHSYEVARETGLGQLLLEFLQSRLCGRRFAGARCAEQEEAQRYGLLLEFPATEDFLGVLED